MNLLPRVIENKPNILSFRQYQYDLIPEIFKMSFIYLKNLGFEFNFKDYKEDIIEDIAYKSINHFASRVYKIKLHKSAKDYFLHISLPNLIDGQFFKLNGALYVPGYFITDSPITVKKKSVLCYSLFNPITFYNGDNRVIFLGHNIPICRFLRLFLSEKEIELAVSEDFLDAKYINENISYSVSKLGEIVGGLTTLEDIKNKFNNIFFDDWTKGLYKEFYNLDDINLDILIRQLLFDSVLNKQEKSFIDLQYKRLTFIENLLTPFFKAISTASKYIINGQQPYKLSIGIGDVIQYFFKQMDKFNFYGIVNGYSGLLDLKATFKNPNSQNELPSEVSSIHPSYKHKIDIISISNTQPGRVVSLVPHQNLKSLKYGLFDFSK